MQFNVNAGTTVVFSTTIFSLPFGMMPDSNGSYTPTSDTLSAAESDTDSVMMYTDSQQLMVKTILFCSRENVIMVLEIFREVGYGCMLSSKLKRFGFITYDI